MFWRKNIKVNRKFLKSSTKWWRNRRVKWIKTNIFDPKILWFLEQMKHNQIKAISNLKKEPHVALGRLWEVLKNCLKIVKKILNRTFKPHLLYNKSLMYLIHLFYFHCQVIFSADIASASVVHAIAIFISTVVPACCGCTTSFAFIVSVHAIDLTTFSFWLDLLWIWKYSSFSRLIVYE